MRRTFSILPVAVMLILWLIGCTQNNNHRLSVAAQSSGDPIWHYSVIDAMRNGIYEGEYSIKDMKEHGDFGLGTYNYLDGELIALDGVFYRILPSGKVEVASEEKRSPFTAITFFHPDTTVQLSFTGNLDTLLRNILQILPANNLPYALKITATWQNITVGGANPVDKNDTTGLAVLMQSRPQYKGTGIKGTMVGYYTPALMSNIDLSPFHFHFISEDKKLAGHIMSGNLNNAKLTVIIDEKSGYQVNLLNYNERFRKLSFESKAASATY